MIKRALALLVIAVGALTPVASAADPGLTGRLEVVRSRVPQGLPFRFTIEIKNHTGISRRTAVSFDLSKPGSDTSAVSFRRVVTSLAPGQSETVPIRVVPAQWFGDRGKFEIHTRSSDVPAASLSFRVGKPTVRVPRFEEVSTPAGVGTVHRAADSQCDKLAAGAAWSDVEGDGDLDLYLAQQEGPSQLFISEGGHFTDQAANRGVDSSGIATAAVFADYDNDGDQDLYVVAHESDHLFRNSGDGTFIDVTLLAGITESNPGSSASWGDYDRDGYLDIYVANWGEYGGTGSQCNSFSRASDTLYHNRGDGTFQDVTSLLKGGATLGAGFEASWFDYDLDGDDDLYLGNDFLGQSPVPNALWRNDGPDGAGGWKFTDVSVDSGAGLAINTMGLAPGDYDRDGDLDLALSNIFATKLLRNQGNGSFSEVGEEAGVARPEQRAEEPAVTWGMGFSDLNNDSWEDLFVVGGSLQQEANPEPQLDALFVNLGKGRFADLSAPSGLADPQAGRGVAFADYDRDGRMDLYVVNRYGVPKLYHNVTPAKRAHWLEVDLVGSRSNRDGCGALVTVRLPKEPPLMREVFCGSMSLGSGSETIAHFGLGADRKVKRLTIRWPSGTQQALQHVKADQRLVLTEPA